MKKIKRNTTSIPEAINMAYNYDMSHKGFAIDHKEKILYVMEVTILQFAMATKNF